MSRLAGTLVLAALAAVTAVRAQPMPPSGLSHWNFDEITVSNGARFQGLILSEDPTGIQFQSVYRLPGRPTVTLTSFFAKGEIASVSKLSEEERKLLKKRLAELDPSGIGERNRMDSLELELVEWDGKPGTVKRYKSDHFILECSGTEDLTRRCAVRLEQIYAAFARFLPPAARETQPTTIMLATDREEYRKLLGPLGETLLLNPAVFDPQANRILCGSDLKRLGSELQTARLHHSQQLATLKRYEENLTRLYRQPELERFLAPIAVERKRIFTVEQANGAKFDLATVRIFAILYHETFHAYVGRFVHPPLDAREVKAGKGTGELPRWLNEGLAQVFETAMVEAGELRADVPDRERLSRVKDWLRGKQGSLLPLSDLLLTNKEAFLAFHADQKAATDRAYLTSWALAYYLTFDRRVIGTAEFRKYLIAINSGGDPRQAFRELVGKDLTVFEKEWHAYLMRLKRDGSVEKP
jgi:hypothetical protein